MKFGSLENLVPTHILYGTMAPSLVRIAPVRITRQSTYINLGLPGGRIGDNEVICCDGCTRYRDVLLVNPKRKTRAKQNTCDKPWNWQLHCEGWKRAKGDTFGVEYRRV
jgi:hypothetical protein